MIDVSDDMEASTFGQLDFTDLQHEYDEIHEIAGDLPRDRERNDHPRGCQVCSKEPFRVSTINRHGGSVWVYWFLRPGIVW